MGIAKLYGQKASGTNINGIIKDYHAYAGENVSPGDLVEYINGIAEQTTEISEETVLNNSATHTGYAISAVQLDENRVFVVHSHTSGSYYLYGVIVTIDGATITVGTDTVLSSDSYTGYGVSAQLLSNGTVFIAHCYSSARYLYGMVVTINGTTISKGTDTELSSTSYSGEVISTRLLDGVTVFIAHGGENYYRLYGIIVTTNGTTISSGTDTRLTSTSFSGYGISMQLLENGNVFIAHCYGSSYYLYGMICTISGTTISAGTDIQFNSTKKAGQKISTSLLPNGKIFISHSNDTNFYLYGMVVTIVTIDGTTNLNAGTDYSLGSTYSGYAISNQLLPSGKVFIAHCNESSSYYLYGVIVTIDENTVTKGTSVQLNPNRCTGYSISTLLLNNGNVFIAHSHTTNNYYLYAQIFGIDEANNIPTNNVTINEYETQVRKTTTSKFDGVAKEVAETYDTVLVQEDIIPKTWTEVTAGTEYVADDGTRIVATSYHVQEGNWTFTANNACNGLLGGYDQTWYSDGNELNPKYTIIFPGPKKITKMLASISFGAVWDECKIVGSNDGVEWKTLYDLGENTLDNEEITLSNVDYYTMYRVEANWSTLVNNMIFSIKEIQTSEYETVEQGKDLVSIYTLEPKPENLLLNADFSDGINNWTSNVPQITPTIEEENGEKILVNTVNSLDSGYSQSLGGSYQQLSQLPEHIYYASVYYKGKSTNTSTVETRLAIPNIESNTAPSTQSDWQLLSMYNIFGGNNKFILRGDVGSTATVGDQYFYKKPKLYDLTEFYGEGNEPTKEWCDENLSIL